MAPIISSPVYGVLAEADGRFPLTDISAEGGFRFYDLRHTRHTMSTRSGATLWDTMARAGRRRTPVLATECWQNSAKAPPRPAAWAVCRVCDLVLSRPHREDCPPY